MKSKESGVRVVIDVDIDRADRIAAIAKIRHISIERFIENVFNELSTRQDE